MTALCYTLLENGFGAGVLILAVLLLRPFFRGQANVQCVLWALVAVRLLCPVLPDSSFGVIPHGDVAMEMVSSALQAPKAGETESEPSGQEIAPLPVTETSPVEGQSNLPVATTENPEKGEPLRVLSFLWLAGTVGMLAYLVVSYGRTKREAAISVPLTDGVLLCDGIDTPFLLGLLRPVICIPSAMEEANLPHVLAHERTHLKRRDHWWKLLGFVLLAIYWFHPLVWLAYLLFCRDLELACDQRVIRDMDGEGRKGYASALLSCGVSRFPRPVCPLAFGEVGVKTRIRGVAKYRKPKLWAILGAVVICALVAVCFLTNATRLTPALEKAMEEQTYSVSENRDRLSCREWKVLSVHRKGEETKVYTLLADMVYESRALAQGGTIGGGGLGPAVLTFTGDEDVGYTFHDLWWPEDGSYYWPSIQGEFPLWDRVRLRLFYNCGGSALGLLEKCNRKALAYYEALDPDTLLGYARYGYLTPTADGLLFDEVEFSEGYAIDEAIERAEELGLRDTLDEQGYFLYNPDDTQEQIPILPGETRYCYHYTTEADAYEETNDFETFSAYLNEQESKPLFEIICLKEKAGTEWSAVLTLRELEDY